MSAELRRASAVFLVLSKVRRWGAAGNFLMHLPQARLQASRRHGGQTTGFPSLAPSSAFVASGGPALSTKAFVRYRFLAIGGGDGVIKRRDAEGDCVAAEPLAQVPSRWMGWRGPPERAKISRMSAPQIPLGPQRRVLELVYKIFMATGAWPSFQYLSARVWQELEQNLRALYYELSDAGWVRPVVPRTREYELRDDTEISISIRGLTQLSEAAEDVSRFVDTVRYLGDRAARFRPASPTEVEQVQITSEEIRLRLGLNAGDPALTRQAALLLRDARRLWTGFNGPGPSGDWTVTIDPEAARSFRNVQTAIDFLTVSEPTSNAQPMDDAGRAPPDATDALGPTHPSDVAAPNVDQPEVPEKGTSEVVPESQTLDTAGRIELIRTVAQALSTVGSVDRGLILRQFRISPIERPRETPYEFAVRVLEEIANDRLLEVGRYLDEASGPMGRDVPTAGPWAADTFRLFCSHTHHIAARLGPLKARLARYGIDAFVAHADIAPAAPWESVIEEALRTCDALCAFLTAEFHDSFWTDQEVGWVAGRERLVFCIRMGGSPYGFVAKWQAISPADDPDLDELSDAIFNILSTHERSAPTMAEVALSRIEKVRSHDEARSAFRLVERLPIAAWNEQLLARAERITAERPWLHDSDLGDTTIASAVAALVDRIRAEAGRP